MNTAELLSFLVGLYPRFALQWNSPENLHREGDEFTPHGVCAEFSTFFVEQGFPLEPSSASNLFRKIEEVVAQDATKQSAVANALCTCFLENIACTPVGSASLPFMGPESRKFFEHWHAEP